MFQSHPNLSMEERSRLCRCLNHEKLSLETCKALAKNPRVPPRTAVEALKCQARGGGCLGEEETTTMAMVAGEEDDQSSSGYYSECQRVLSSSSFESEGCSSGTGQDNNQEMKLNLQRMQWRVVELEKVCREMKSNMSSLVRQSAITSHLFTTELYQDYVKYMYMNIMYLYLYVHINLILYKIICFHRIFSIKTYIKLNCL